MNMFEWIENLPKQKKAMPVLSFPGMQLVGTTVAKLVRSGELQAQCMKAIADRYDIAASISLMDLSVEAEAFGSPVRYSDDEVPTVTGAIINDEDDANALVVPKVGAGRTGEYVKTISEAKKLIKDRPVLAGSIGPFSLAGRLMDMTEIMIKCYTEPETVHATLEKVTEFLIEYNKAFKGAGADGILMAEPAAGLLSPDLIAEFSSPYVKKIIEAVEEENCAFIYHNCGNTIPLIENILTIGAKAYHFGNQIDLSEMLPKVPSNVVVLGNVDPARVIRNGSKEDVRTKTTEVLEKCSKYDNFVISSGCDIPPMSPIENIDEFFLTIKEFYAK